MATRTKDTTQPTRQPARQASRQRKTAVQVQAGNSDEEDNMIMAEGLNSPWFAALRVISQAQSPEMAKQLDATSMMLALGKQAKAIKRGDMARAEEMLSSQASALQALFARLVERAMSQEHMPNFEGFMRMALRAQSQCRATLETLSAIKHPPVVYARQANVTTGPQQVNNGFMPTQAREVEIPPTRLSEGSHELPQDTRAPSLASGADQKVEALGEIQRAKDAGG